MSTKFTRGPWKAERTIDNCCQDGNEAIWGSIMSDNGFYVARIWNDIDEERDETEPRANAHLIAAAPMLYEAMDRILNAEDATQYGVDNDNRDARYRELAMALQDGRAALKAARGES